MHSMAHQTSVLTTRLSFQTKQKESYALYPEMVGGHIRCNIGFL